ncbi:hypothetical protein ACOMHN_036011 [Nucella lapillus]
MADCSMEPLPLGQDQVEKFRCVSCGQVVSHRNNVSRHRRKCQGMRHLQCGVCGKEFYRRDLYQGHLWTAHHLQDAGDHRARQHAPGLQAASMYTADME